MKRRGPEEEKPYTKNKASTSSNESGGIKKCLTELRGLTQTRERRDMEGKVICLANGRPLSIPWEQGEALEQGRAPFSKRKGIQKAEESEQTLTC